MITDDKIVAAITFFIPFLFSLCFHEYAHGWMAKRLGDNTAFIMGRLTLNPMAHIDWMGTVVIPLMSVFTGIPLFGWAKPVPVNARNLNNPRTGMFWVALAGPMSNIFLFLCGLVFLTLVELKIFAFQPTLQFYSLVYMFLTINLYLAFFNLLPIHPLDGGKIISRFLPLKWDIWLESKQDVMQMVLLLLVIVGGLRILALPVDWVLEESVDLIKAIVA